jgi:hypothetical protein
LYFQIYPKESIFKKLFSSSKSTNEWGFKATLFGNNQTEKEVVDKGVKLLLDKFISPILYLHEPFAGNFVEKLPKSNSAMFPHQDWTFVDERKFRSINCWIPLQDVNHENGCMYILQGSHKWDFTYRGTNIPSSTKDFDFNLDKFLAIPLKVGQVLIYDHRLIHASPPNKTRKNRLAVAINYKPQKADLIHSVQNADSGRIDIYNIDNSFFHKYSYGADSANVQSVMEGYRKLQTEVYEPIFFV